MIQKKQWLTRLKMRKQLGIKDSVGNNDFGYHGRLIPPHAMRTGKNFSELVTQIKSGSQKQPVRTLSHL